MRYCVSADTKTWACWLYVLATLWLTTCGSPLNTCHFYGDLCLLAG